MGAAGRHLLETYTGRFVDYVDPDPGTIRIEDIAHALANTCRFGGHVKRYYSVAEHSILVCRLLDSGSARRLRLPALLHDAHEAYLGDLPTPLKNAVGQEYKVMAAGLDEAICRKFGTSLFDLHAPPVVWADAVALRIEAHVLKHSTGTHPEWDAAWERHGLRDIEHVKQLLYVIGNRSRLEDWSPGMTPDRAEAAFLSEYERLRESRYAGSASIT